jgi:hypothetical protein
LGERQAGTEAVSHEKVSTDIWAGVDGDGGDGMMDILGAAAVFLYLGALFYAAMKIIWSDKL